MSFAFLDHIAIDACNLILVFVTLLFILSVHGLTTLWLIPSHLMSWTWFCPLHLSHLLAFIASDGCNELDRLDLRWSRLFHTSLS